MVASWLGDGPEGASTRDEPGTYDASYAPVAVDGDVVVATGTSSYRDIPDGPVVRTFHNCFVMRFDDDGRCREFTEYYSSGPDRRGLAALLDEVLLADQHEADRRGGEGQDRRDQR